MTKESREKIFLIDTSSLFFRAFYAIRPLTTPQGLPTNAIYGFLTMVAKILKDEAPHYVVFCYDRKEPSFRKEIYAEYKANRSEMPEDLVPQIPYIKKIADLLGIPSVEAPRFEADDVIGTLTKIGRAHDLDVFIVSGDKDFAQLVGPHVWLFDTMKDIKYDAQGVKQKWGIEPSQMIDYLSMVGDSSDNIPGVPGIGPKGAQKLLADYGTLENIYAHVDEIKGATQEKLKSGKDSALLSKKLVIIDQNVPVAQDLPSYHLQDLKKEELRDLLIELNFKNMERMIDTLRTGNAGTPEAANRPPPKPVVVAPPAMVPAHEPAFVQVSDLVVMNGTQDLTVGQIGKHFKHGQEVWGLQNPQGLFLADEKTKTLFALRGDLEELAPAIENFDFVWQGFDLKSFWHQLKLNGKKHVPKIRWDSQLAAYVCHAGESMEWDRVLARYLGETPASLETGEMLFAKQLQLKDALTQRLAENSLETKIFEHMDVPLAPLLFVMECLGVQLDRSLLQVQGAELAKEIQDLEKRIFSAAGESFNVGSPKQLAQILFEKLKLPPSRKTKTGFSTDNEVLEKLRDQHEMPALVLSYRELAKLKSTYVDSLPLLVKEDGRIHTTMNQALTATGRLSSTDPNLQNIPIRTDRGARVRRAFTAAPGLKLMSVDYSQVELRILAHYSGDKNLCQSFQDDLDIHTATASEVFGAKLQDVTSEMRRAAKAINFGIAYGQGAYGLAENLGIGRGESAEIIKKYFTKFPGVHAYIESTIEQATRDGFVQTLYGRRRYMLELQSKLPAVRKFGERAAINAPIQGTASDIVKMAMIEVAKKIDLPMILQVHDELIFEGTAEKLSENLPAVKKIMETVTLLKVPLKANAAIGDNWDEAH
jgi:DNA polymerase-1